MSSSRDQDHALRRFLIYDDLKARVSCDGVPDGVAADLPELYGSLLATANWSRYFDDAQATGACLLEDPRHVLLFTVEGDTVEVLNKFFDIAPEDAARACRALFRALPQARRVHLEVKFPPAALPLPKRVLYATDHMVIPLPATVEEYTASLGKRTRNNLRQYERRLRRDHPDVTVAPQPVGERSEALFQQFLAWKTARFEPRHLTTYWRNNPAFAARFVRLLHDRGEAYEATIEGETAALWFVFMVGESMYSYQGSFDPRLEPYAMGTLLHYWVACDAIRRGATCVHLGWGPVSHNAFMQRFGAVPVTATRLSIFRSQTARVFSSKEALETARRRLEPRARATYRRARRAAGRAARTAGARVRSGRAPEGGTPEAEMRTEPAAYPDLGARVHVRGVPDGLVDELPELYSSTLATEPWFRIYDDAQATGACLLEDPRHVLLFTVEGDTVEVLNKFFDIAPEDAARACRALFRALPQARRVHLEVKFPPAALPLPKRVLYATDHMVIPLPATVEEYTASLGKRTRNNLRQYERRLRRDHPDVTITTQPVDERSREVVDLFVSWKVERFSRQGRVTDWEQRPRAVELFIEMLQNGGEALIATIDGAPAAVWLFFSVGQTIDSSEGSFDPRYEPYALGTIMHYWMSCEAVSRGASQVYLGWGSDSYKQRFGAVPVTATRLSVFRSQTARAYSSKEAVETARRRLEPRAKATYRRARHTAGRLLRRYRPDLSHEADAAPPS